MNWFEKISRSIGFYYDDEDLEPMVCQECGSEDVFIACPDHCYDCYMRIEVKMIIEKYIVYKDGGTVGFITNKGTYCMDNRLGKDNKTRGSMFNGYPEKDNSNLIEDSDDLMDEIMIALKDYDDDFYKASIDHTLLRYKRRNDA